MKDAEFRYWQPRKPRSPTPGTGRRFAAPGSSPPSGPGTGPSGTSWPGSGPTGSARLLRNPFAPGTRSGEGVRTAQAAAQCEDPLEGELVIEREKWAYVERLESGHYFDLEALTAYALKLRILERKARFEAERGEASYGAAYREILDSAGAPASNQRGA
ncbi:MAG: DUF2764 domain-containing protein [Candidatus Moduliflexus flocculans]|nr:DUF2764 domain-containing protein [Candidatus Moduliflexus flocculans]